MTIGAGAIGEFAIGDSGSASYAEAGPGGTGATAAQIWGYQLLPGVTAGQMLTVLYKAGILGTLAPLRVDVQQMNSAEVIGTGTTGDPWRGVGVSP